MIAIVAKLIARRLLAAIPILLIVSALLFCVLRLLPVDPAAMSLPPNATIAEIEAKRHEMGLDRPLPRAISDLAARTRCTAISAAPSRCGREAGSLVAATLPATIQLAVAAMVIAGDSRRRRRTCCCSICAARCSKPVADLVSILLLSIPEFLWGLILLFVFGVALHVLPFTGEVVAEPAAAAHHRLSAARFLAGRALRRVSRARCQHLILPAFALGLAFSPAIMRVLRSSLFDVYHEDYIQQARLRGLSERQILLGHALKNASLPTLTLAGVQFGILFSGTLLVEVIYSYPGMGNLMVDAVRNADLPLIQAIGLTYCVVVLLINTVVDSLYVVLNPKLRVR